MDTTEWFVGQGIVVDIESAAEKAQHRGLSCIVALEPAIRSVVYQRTPGRK